MVLIIYPSDVTLSLQKWNSLSLLFSCVLFISFIRSGFRNLNLDIAKFAKYLDIAKVFIVLCELQL